MLEEPLPEAFAVTTRIDDTFRGFFLTAKYRGRLTSYVVTLIPLTRFFVGQREIADSLLPPPTKIIT